MSRKDASGNIALSARGSYPVMGGIGRRYAFACCGHWPVHRPFVACLRGGGKGPGSTGSPSGRLRSFPHACGQLQRRRERAGPHRHGIRRRCLRWLYPQVSPGHEFSTGGESGSNTLDIQTATYEAGDGRSMHFKSTSFRQGMLKDGEVDGDAKLTAQGDLNVDLKQPKRTVFGSTGETVFPTEHLKRLIEAGRRGDTTLSIRVYDGSNKGDKVYDTLGLIGRRIEPGAALTSVEEPARQQLSAQARWPITISYFEGGQADRHACLQDLVRALREWRQPRPEARLRRFRPARRAEDPGRPTPSACQR